MHRALVLATIATLIVHGATTALAQEPLTLAHAEALIENAEFDSARAALDEIARDDGLSRSDVLRWLELRALLEFALGSDRPLRAALAGIASLDPTYAISASRPPELGESLAEVRLASRGTIAQHVDAQISGADIVLRARVENDPAALVRESRIFARVGGESAWRESATGELAIHATGASVAYYAVAIGPGDAVLAREGSESSPLTLAAPERSLGEVEPGHADDTSPLWTGLGIGIGAAVVAALGITLGIVLTPEPTTPVGPPVFDFELTGP